MNIAELAIRKGTVTWSLSFAVLILGWLAYQDLPRLAEPELSVGEILVVTPYPGASAQEVEQEVAEKIELAIRGLDGLRRVESYSSRGLSVVKAIRDKLDRHRLPQVRDELRRKIDSVQPELPPDAGPSMVDDDFGELHAVYYALVGEGFTQAELKRVAELVQRELGSLGGVKNTILFGEQQETIFVEISNAKAKAFGVGLDRVLDALRSKNLPADAGRIRVGPEYVPIHPSRLYRSEQDLGGLLIAGEHDRLTRLDDVAEIRRGYEDPPRRLLRVDGNPAIGIALSAVPGGDLVAMGETVERRLAQLESKIPLGMELKAIGLQPHAIAEAIDGFLANLALAIAVVIAALAFFMGLRGGLIIGFVALLTLAGTLSVMDYLQIGLNRISLGALIIALGPLTTNAIVVVDGIKMRMNRGMGSRRAALEAVSRNTALLLGTATVVALAFVSVGHLDNSAVEYTRDIYRVLPIALTIGWATALTAAPMLAERFLESPAPGRAKRDPYATRSYRLYSGILAAAIGHRRAVLGSVALLVALSLYGFGFVKRVHFPATDNSAFLVEVYFREGTHIRETERQMDEIQAYLRTQSGITRVATAIGGAHPRHLPIYKAGHDLDSRYGVGLVFVDDHRRIAEARLRIQADLETRFPDAVVNVKQYLQAPATTGGRIQVRISGPDPVELRRLADRAKAVIAEDPDAKAVRDEWGAKVKVAHPVLGEDRAHRLRIGRKRIADAFRTAYSGTLTGYYREGSALMPIVARAPLEERNEVEDMADIQATSPLRGDRVPMLQIVDRLDTLTEDARRTRRNYRPTIGIHADANRGATFELFERIKPRVEKALGANVAARSGRDPGSDFEVAFDTFPIVGDGMIPLKGKPGYFMSWGGEAESAARSWAQLAGSIPLFFGLTILITIALFNALRPPLIAVLTLPLSMIGVTAGLLLTGQPFGFMSLLGVIGLSGMLLGNAILTVDGMARAISTRNAHLATILDAASGVGRLTVLCAGTTILALLPLLGDTFFRSMAVTITAGLGVASLLSLVLIPVLYAALFGVGDEYRG